MAAAAAERAERYAWPRVTAEVVEAYEDAIAMPIPDSARSARRSRIGARPPTAAASVPAACPASRATAAPSAAR